MTHRATLVLSLCFALLTPLAASAQTTAPATPAAPAPTAPSTPDATAPAADDAVPSDPAAAPAPAAPPAPEAPAAPSDPAAAPVPAIPAAPPAPEAPAAADAVPSAPAEASVTASPAAPAAPEEPAAQPAAAAEPAAPSSQEASASIKIDTSAPPSEKADSAQAAETGEQKKADAERCAQLMAQGNTALAQAEGCGGGDSPIYAGSIISFSQTTAPAYRTLPNTQNGFYALSLYVAPRLKLSDDWALLGNITLAYEATRPDDTTYRNYLWRTDTFITAQGNLFSYKGFIFTGGPRLVAPTSQASIASNVFAGTGGALNIIRQFDVLDGLALVAGGSYIHTFSGRLTRRVTDTGGSVKAYDNAGNYVGTTNELRRPLCNGPTETIDCSGGNTRVVQDAFRAVGAASLNFTPEWNLQVSYLYGWNLVKPWASGGDVTLVDATSGRSTNFDGKDLSGAIGDTRWRRIGYLQLAISYQPATWVIATLQGQTGVCYDQSSGGQSATGGCSGALHTSDFWLRNPIANKYSNVALQFTVPIDAFIAAVTKGGSEEKKTAKAKGKIKL